MNFSLFLNSQGCYVCVGCKVTCGAKVFEKIEEDDWKVFARLQDGWMLRVSQIGGTRYGFRRFVLRTLKSFQMMCETWRPWFRVGG